MNFETNNDRRTFVKTVSAAMAAGTAVGGFHSSNTFGAEDKKLGFALVGLGGLSTNQIAPGLLKAQHCKLTAVVTGTPSKEKTWADKYGISQDHIYNYENFDKIANDDTVDVIYVVLPNSMHAEYVERAAKAGKHVFCEKPMANSADDCRRMIEACKAANVKLGVGYRCQFEPHHLQCMQFAQEKTFGAIKHITAGFGFKIGDPTQWRLRKDLAGGGALMDVGIYALQSCRYLTGEEPELVSAIETKTDHEKFAEVDETIVWDMKFPSGVTASCTTTYNFNGINRFRANCDRGEFGLDPAYNYDGLRGTTSRGPIEAANVDQFATELDAFSQSILNDEPFKAPGEEGLRDLIVIEAIYKSIREGTTVKLS